MGTKNNHSDQFDIFFIGNYGRGYFAPLGVLYMSLQICIPVQKHPVFSGKSMVVSPLTTVHARVIYDKFISRE